ncbi:MAG TPA: aspartate aminotransferase family protein [Candidatus Binataceae bacterium]|jgi:4-aminobutyrate aminotransferase-like enzyme|nr:aspartate aminotransferase family protein [Candidatus Binataceae bacterium]
MREDEEMRTAQVSTSKRNNHGTAAAAKLPKILTAVPGPRSREIFADEQRHIAPGRQRISLLAGIAFEYGNGATLTDADENIYVDFFAGVAVASLGHAHPAMAGAIAKQAARLTVGTFATRERAEAFRLMSEVAPANLKRAHLYSGGAEAVEAALRLARSVTKKDEVVSFWGGFHGKTMGVLGLIGDESKQGYGPLPGGRYQVPYADCYRCPFKMTYPDCGLYCVEFARKQIRNSSAGAIAALIVEPMQGTAGNVIPPDDWLPAIKSVAQENGALLVADEMITGFGRTGKWWGVDHSGVIPDIVTVGKGMGSGFPVSGVLMSDEISRAEPFAKPSASSSSYGGNPLAATALTVTIKTIEREKLVENSRKVGALMLKRLLELKEKYDFVGDVRGRGLLIGLDLVRDRRSRRELGRAVTELIFTESLKRGLLIMGYFPRMRINPPLVITEDQAEAGIAILDEVFAHVRDHADWRNGD